MRRYDQNEAGNDYSNQLNLTGHSKSLSRRFLEVNKNNGKSQRTENNEPTNRFNDARSSDDAVNHANAINESNYSDIPGVNMAMHIRYMNGVIVENEISNNANPQLSFIQADEQPNDPRKSKPVSREQNQRQMSLNFENQSLIIKKVNLEQNHLQKRPSVRGQITQNSNFSQGPQNDDLAQIILIQEAPQNYPHPMKLNNIINSASIQSSLNIKSSRREVESAYKTFTVPQTGMVSVGNTQVQQDGGDNQVLQGIWRDTAKTQHRSRKVLLSSSFQQHMVTEQNKSKLKKMNVGQEKNTFNIQNSPETTRMEVEGWRIISGEQSHKEEVYSHIGHKSTYGAKSAFGIKSTGMANQPLYMKLENGHKTTLSTLSRTRKANISDRVDKLDSSHLPSKDDFKSNKLPYNNRRKSKIKSFSRKKAKGSSQGKVTFKKDIEKIQDLLQSNNVSVADINNKEEMGENDNAMMSVFANQTMSIESNDANKGNTNDEKDIKSLAKVKKINIEYDVRKRVGSFDSGGQATRPLSAQKYQIDLLNNPTLTAIPTQTAIFKPRFTTKPQKPRKKSYKMHLSVICPDQHNSAEKNDLEQLVQAQKVNLMQKTGHDSNKNVNSNNQIDYLRNSNQTDLFEKVSDEVEKTAKHQLSTINSHGLLMSFQPDNDTVKSTQIPFLQEHSSIETTYDKDMKKFENEMDMSKLEKKNTKITVSLEPKNRKLGYLHLTGNAMSRSNQLLQPSVVHGVGGFALQQKSFNLLQKMNGSPYVTNEKPIRSKLNEDVLISYEYPLIQVDHSSIMQTIDQSHKAQDGKLKKNSQQQWKSATSQDFWVMQRQKMHRDKSMNMNLNNKQQQDQKIQNFDFGYYLTHTSLFAKVPSLPKLSNASNINLPRNSSSQDQFLDQSDQRNRSVLARSSLNLQETPDWRRAQFKSNNFGMQSIDCGWSTSNAHEQSYTADLAMATHTTLNTQQKQIIAPQVKEFAVHQRRDNKTQSPNPELTMDQGILSQQSITSKRANDDDFTNSPEAESMTIKKVVGDSTHRATLSKNNDVAKEGLQLTIDDTQVYESQHTSSKKQNNYNLSLQRTISTRNNQSPLLIDEKNENKDLSPVLTGATLKNFSFKRNENESKQTKQLDQVDFKVKIRQTIVSRDTDFDNANEMGDLVTTPEPNTKFLQDIAYLKNNSIIDYTANRNVVQELKKYGLEKLLEPQQHYQKRRGPTIAKVAPRTINNKRNDHMHAVLDIITSNQSKSDDISLREIKHVVPPININEQIRNTSGADLNRSGINSNKPIIDYTDIDKTIGQTKQSQDQWENLQFLMRSRISSRHHTQSLGFFEQTTSSFKSQPGNEDLREAIENQIQQSAVNNFSSLAPKSDEREEIRDQAVQEDSKSNKMINIFEENNVENKMFPAIVPTTSTDQEIQIVNINQGHVDYSTVKMSLENTRRCSEVPVETKHDYAIKLNRDREMLKSQDGRSRNNLLQKNLTQNPVSKMIILQKPLNNGELLPTMQSSTQTLKKNTQSDNQLIKVKLKQSLANQNQLKTNSNTHQQHQIRALKSLVSNNPFKSDKPGVVSMPAIPKNLVPHPFGIHRPAAEMSETRIKGPLAYARYNRQESKNIYKPSVAVIMRELHFQ